MPAAGPVIELLWTLRTPGPMIESSLTEAETQELRDLSRGMRVLEIGAAYGYSTVIMGMQARRLYSVDPHQELKSLDTYRANLAAYGVEKRVTVVIGTSPDALWRFKPNGFDFVFIDGDHTVKSATGDNLAARRVVKPGGYLAFHDYGEITCPGVAEALDEIYPDGPLRLTDSLFIVQK